MLLVPTAGKCLIMRTLITASKLVFDDDVKEFEHICMFRCFAVITGHSEKKNIINQGDWLTERTGVAMLVCMLVS